MSRYFVLGFVDATIPKTVEASSPEEARYLFLGSTSATVCSYCSDKMDVATNHAAGNISGTDLSAPRDRGRGSEP